MCPVVSCLRHINPVGRCVWITQGGLPPRLLSECRLTVMIWHQTLSFCRFFNQALRSRLLTQARHNPASFIKFTHRTFLVEKHVGWMSRLIFHIYMCCCHGSLRACLIVAQSMCVAWSEAEFRVYYPIQNVENDTPPSLCIKGDVLKYWIYNYHKYICISELEYMRPCATKKITDFKNKVIILGEYVMRKKRNHFKRIRPDLACYLDRVVILSGV